MSSKSRLEALENLAAGDEGQDIRFFFTSSDEDRERQQPAMDAAMAEGAKVIEFYTEYDKEDGQKLDCPGGVGRL